jgi:hypothetical protein
MGSRPRPSATVSAPVTNRGARSGLASDGYRRSSWQPVSTESSPRQPGQPNPANPTQRTQPSESSPADPAQPPRSKAKLTRASESSTDRQPAFDRRPSTPLPRSHDRGCQPIQESFRRLCHPCARTRSATHVPRRDAPPMCPDAKRHPRARTRSVAHLPGREVSPMCPDAKRHRRARTRSATDEPGPEAPPMCPDANLPQPLPGDAKMTTRTAVWACSASPRSTVAGMQAPQTRAEQGASDDTSK